MRTSNNPFHRSFMLLMTSILLGCMASSLAIAQEKVAEVTGQDLPTGVAVMNNYIEASGGQQAFDAIKNRYSESTLELVAQGITLDIQTWAARPNSLYFLMESDIVGKVEKGCDGEVFWESSLMSGPVVHDGVQHIVGVRDSTFERFAHWSDIYESAECIGTAEVGDHNCLEVVLTPKRMEEFDDEDAYQPIHLFIDDSDWLIRKMHSVIKSEAGSIEVQAFADDYREVDGILFAHQLKMNMLGQTRIVTTTKLEHNIDMPEDRFALPEDIQKLID
ncbi:MAG: outer membrane lipoprotein-sorting protein [Pirellulaceae bacterium]